MWKCSFDSRTRRTPRTRIQSFPSCRSRTFNPLYLLFCSFLTQHWFILSYPGYENSCPSILDFIYSPLSGCKIDTRETTTCWLLPIIHTTSYMIGSISSPSNHRRTSHLYSAHPSQNAMHVIGNWPPNSSKLPQGPWQVHHGSIINCIVYVL